VQRELDQVRPLAQEHRDLGRCGQFRTQTGRLLGIGSDVQHQEVSAVAVVAVAAAVAGVAVLAAAVAAAAAAAADVAVDPAGFLAAGLLVFPAPLSAAAVDVRFAVRSEPASGQDPAPSTG
jgi:hypothetical protein